MNKNVILNLVFGVIGLILSLMAGFINSEVWTGIAYGAVAGIFGGVVEYLMVGSTWKNFAYRIGSTVVGALLGVGLYFIF